MWPFSWGTKKGLVKQVVPPSLRSYACTCMYVALSPGWFTKNPDITDRLPKKVYASQSRINLLTWQSRGPAPSEGRKNSVNLHCSLWAFCHYFPGVLTTMMCIDVQYTHTLHVHNCITCVQYCAVWCVPNRPARTTVMGYHNQHQMIGHTLSYLSTVVLTLQHKLVMSSWPDPSSPLVKGLAH